MEDSVICLIFVCIHVYTFFCLRYISIRSIFNLSVYYNHVCVGWGRQENEVETRGDANSATCRGVPGRGVQGGGRVLAVGLSLCRLLKWVYCIFIFVFVLSMDVCSACFRVKGDVERSILCSVSADFVLLLFTNMPFV